MVAAPWLLVVLLRDNLRLHKLPIGTIGGLFLILQGWTQVVWALLVAVDSQLVIEHNCGFDGLPVDG